MEFDGGDRPKHLVRDGDSKFGGRFDAILLAMAGLVRLGRDREVTEALDARAFVPAPGRSEPTLPIGP